MGKTSRRTIVVGGEEYHWKVTQRGDAARLVVRPANIIGQYLLKQWPAIVLCVPKRGREGSYVQMDVRMPPQSVSLVIAEALRLGWRPTETGLPPFALPADSSGDYDFYGSEVFAGFGVDRERLRDLRRLSLALGRDVAWRRRLRGSLGTQVPIDLSSVRCLDPDLAVRLQTQGGVSACLRSGASRYWQNSDQADDEPDRELVLWSPGVPYPVVMDAPGLQGPGKA